MAKSARNSELFLRPPSRPLFLLFDFIRIVVPFGGVGHLQLAPTKKLILTGSQFVEEFFRRSRETEEMGDCLNFRCPFHVKSIHRRFIDRLSDGYDAVSLDH